MEWREAIEWKEKKDAFVDLCLNGETEQEREKRINFENALSSIQVNYVSQVSDERARRIYGVRFAISKLYEDSLEGKVSADKYHILLALADELKDLEGKRGVIPALETLRHIDKKNEHEILSYGPDLFFVPLIEYLQDSQMEIELAWEEINKAKRDVEDLRSHAGSRSVRTEASDREIEIVEDEIKQQKRIRQLAHDIVAALDFAHRIYDWNTGYFMQNREVGALSPGGNYEAERDMKGPHANYLIRWRGTAFAIWRAITEQRMLDYLSPSKRFDVIKTLIAVMKKELLNREYYNPAIFEEPPQTRSAVQILGDLKTDYMLNSEQPLRVRVRIRNELRRLVRHPDLAYPDEAYELLREDT